MRTITALFLLTLLPVSLSGQTASTPEQRTWAKDESRWLEEHPMDADSKSRAAELLTWWTQVPDLSLSVCPLLIETKNKKIAPAVVAQAMFSAGAYLIDHRDATRSDLALAGVEGALRAYRNAIAADPKLKDRFLDGLIAAQDAGKLAESYVAPVVKKCEEAERSKR